MQFSTIYGDVCTAIGDPQQVRLAEVKAVINTVYLNELLNADPMRPMYWLRYLDDSIKTKIPGSITAISKANPCVVTISADTFATGDIVNLYAILGMTELNNRVVKLTRTGASNYSLANLDGTAINSTNFTTYTSGGSMNHRGVTLSSSVRSILSVNWVGYSNPLIPITAKELEENTTWWAYGTSTNPLRYQHIKTLTAAGVEADMILWFALGPSTAAQQLQLRIWYESSPVELSATTDYPILPVQFHSAIVSGAVARLGENKTQVEAGPVWPQVYKMQREALIDFNRKLWKEYDPQRSKPYLQ